MCDVQRLWVDVGRCPATTSPGGAKLNAPLDHEELEPDGHRADSVSARLAYLAADRPDIAFACKECRRAVGKATRADLTRLTRIGRYLLHAPRAVCEFPTQDAESIMTRDGLSDADEAWCTKRDARHPGPRVMHCKVPNSAENDESATWSIPLNEWRKALSSDRSDEVVVQGSRDGTVGCEETGRTSTVQGVPQQSSEVMQDAPEVREVHRGSRIQPRWLKVSR